MEQRKLLNINEIIPDVFYIFINEFMPITQHNLNTTKSFISAAYSYCAIDRNFINAYINGLVYYLPFIKSDTDIKIISPYCLNAINDYRVEYDTETYRKNTYPFYPSRLSAIYAFGDYRSCELVSKKYNWYLDSVKTFKLAEYNELTRVIKVNMEIISLARTAYRVGMLDNDTINTIWFNYWSGKVEIEIELPIPYPNKESFMSDEMFEYLIEGKMVLIE